MKTVTVPVNAGAMQRLDYNQNLPGDLVEISLSSDTVNNLFTNRFFPKINALLDICIDDFEDDFEDEKIVDADKLHRLNDFLAQEIRANPKPVYSEIQLLVLLAIERKTGIFFFF